MQSGGEFSRFGIEISNPIWRVSLKAYPPFSPPPASVQVYGRFDDPLDADKDDANRYSVLYCTQSSVAAFVETMGGLRPKLGAVEDLLKQMLISVDERESTAALLRTAGEVTRDWQHANHLTSGSVVTSALLFDLANAGAVQTLRIHLAPSLIAMGLDDLDFGELLGSNRTLTQAISRWVWLMKDEDGQPLFSGIRYRSRFDPECMCLALYEDRYSIDGDVDIQPINRETPGFAEAASILRLRIA